MFPELDFSLCLSKAFLRHGDQPANSSCRLSSSDVSSFCYVAALNVCIGPQQGVPVPAKGIPVPTKGNAVLNMGNGPLISLSCLSQ